MKQDLTLNVGTKYNDDGLKKLDHGLKNASKAVGSASRALGAISNELGQVGGAAGKAAGAVSGLFSSFMQGGIVAGAVAAITAGIGLLVSAFKEAKEQAKNAVTAMADYFDRAFDNAAKKIQMIKETLNFKTKERNIEENQASKEKELASREQTNQIKNVSLQARQAADDKFNKAKEKAAKQLSSAFGKSMNDDDILAAKSKLVESLDEQRKQISQALKDNKSADAY